MIYRVTSSYSPREGRRITPQIGASSADETTEALIVGQVAQLAAAIAALPRK